MRILLTGATGGIGSAIGKRLRKHYEVLEVRHDDPHDALLIDIDWLVCAHGILDEKKIEGTFKANTLSIIHLIERLKDSKVIVISSTAGINGNDKYPVYAASKAAINSYCKSISKTRECYALCPGPTDTRMWRGLGLKGQAQDPDEVAKVVERIILGGFRSGDIITIRDGEVEEEGW